MGTLAAVLAVAGACMGGPQRAARICRPPPAHPPPGPLPNCLVVGDSVSIGMTPAIAANLSGVCNVLHAPFSGDGGACDTRYGLQCADLWFGMSLDGTAAPRYDAITFNFGLHDTNDEGFDEEARDEFVPVSEYGANLKTFLSKIRTHQPQAKVAWLTSTPMHFDMHLNANVIAYNAESLKQLNGSQPLVDSTMDLYEAIVSQCGNPPYYGSKLAPNVTQHCSLINDNEEYHYNTQGWNFLAGQVARKFRGLLAMQDASANVSPAPVGPSVRCPDGKTACPISFSCVADEFSNSKWGCCPVKNGSSCNDGFHCCAGGTTCFANGTNPISPQKPTPLPYSHVCR